MHNELKIIEKDHNHLRAEWRNLYVVIYRLSPTLSNVEAVERESKDLASRHADGIAMAVVIEPTSGVPEATVRTKSTEVLSSLGKSLRGVVTVPEGAGIWAATMRSMLTGVAMVVPAGYAQEICRTPEETATALAKFLGGKAPATELQTVLADIRAAYAVTTAPEQARKKSWWQW